MTRKLDVDAALDEPEPIEVVLFGETYTVPAEMPASVFLRVQSMRQRGDDADVTELDLRRFFSDIFSEATFDVWLERGVSFPRLEKALELLMEAWQGEGDGSGEAKEAGQSSS